jgi:ferredoxin
VYCCGPERLLDAVTEACARHGWPADALHVERFRAPRTEAPSAAPGKVEVECRRSGVTVAVAAGEPLLPALLAAGVDVVTSCEEGICGTCEVRVLDGAPRHRDFVLTAAEQAERNRMMVCVSGGESERLVLDL